MHHGKFGNLNSLSFYNGKRVLVTGHTGFKGGWLSIWLNMLGADVYGYALDPIHKEGIFLASGIGSRINDSRGDILERRCLEDYLESTQPEILFHLAAQPLVLGSYNDPCGTFEVNVQGTVNVLEAARKSNSLRAAVFITSDKCYENMEWVYGYRENDRLGGHDPYSASKGAAEIVIASYIRSFFGSAGTPGIASVRAGNVIGGGDWAPNRLVPDIYRALKENKVLEIRNPGAVRPWQHVLEPLSGYLMLGARLYEEKERYTGAWNFGPYTHETYTVSDLIGEFVRSTQKERHQILLKPENSHESSKLTLDISKANQLLGWYPIFDFKEMVYLTAEWYADLHSEDVLLLSQSQIKKYQDKWSLLQDRRKGL